MLDSATGTQFRKKKYVCFSFLDDILNFCLGRLPGAKDMVEKVAMEVFGNGLPLFSIRLMDSYPQNYILGTTVILDFKRRFH